MILLSRILWYVQSNPIGQFVQKIDRTQLKRVKALLFSFMRPKKKLHDKSVHIIYVHDREKKVNHKINIILESLSTM